MVLARDCPTGPLKLVLVVEDDFFIAAELELILTEGGFRVLGPVATVAAALGQIARQAPDVAVLDVNLQGEWVTPVAKMLRLLHIPYVLTTSYPKGQLRSQDVLTAVPNLGKPTNPLNLLKTLRNLV